MIKTDRMGGFISASIISTDDIESFSILNNQASLIYKAGKSPLSLEIVKNGVSLSVTPQETKAGVIYTISGQIELKNSVEMNFFAFNKYMLILTNALNQNKIVALPYYPVTISRHPLTPSDASGRTGDLLKFNGKSAVYPFSDLI